MRKQKTPWLPRKGHKVEVRDPVSGRNVSISERLGFWIIVGLAVAVILLAVYAR